MADEATSSKRPRRRWLLLLLPLAAVAGYYVYDTVRPRTEEERVLEAWEDFLDATEDHDWERLWGLTCAYTRDEYAKSLDRLKNLVPDEPKDREKFRADYGLDPEVVPGLDPEEFFGGLLEGIVTQEAEEHRRQVENARRVTLGHLNIRDNIATLKFEMDGRWVLTVKFEEEEGEWRFWFGVDNWFLEQHEPLPFQTLERKVDAFLPLYPDDEGVGIVIEVGDDSVSAPLVADLQKLLRGLAKSLREAGQDTPVVLLEVHPAMAMADFMRILDAPLLAGFRKVTFADTTETIPPPGTRINGIPLDEVEEFSTLPNAIHCTAIERTIGVGGFAMPWRFEVLRQLREERQEK